VNSQGSSATRRITKKVFRSAGYDLVQFPQPRSHAENVTEILRGLGINLVIDVGANVGQTGISLRSIGYRGAIASFEPAARSFAQLRDEAANDPLWTAHCLALGARAERRTLNGPAQSQLASFLVPNDFGTSYYNGSSGEEKELVDVERLDALFRQLVASITHPRVFLKIDAQGFDLEVLAGAEGCLDAILAVQVELALKPTYAGSPDYREVIEVLNERGFEVSGFFPVSRDERLRLLDFDCVLVRPDAFEVGA
jgi:FkbM family methyltransferase